MSTFNCVKFAHSDPSHELDRSLMNENEKQMRYELGLDDEEDDSGLVSQPIPQSEKEPVQSSESDPQPFNKQVPPMGKLQPESWYVDQYAEVVDDSIEFATGNELKKNSKKARTINPDNMVETIEILKTEKFKEFKLFIKDSLQLYEKTNITNDECVKWEIEKAFFHQLNKDMKNKNGVLYKKLTTKLYDSDPKQKKYQNVKIKRTLIKSLQREFGTKDSEIESLVESAITDYLRVRNEYSD